MSAQSGHFGPAPEGDPLTAAEVATLPEGTPVVVIWSGGNGPHRYTITVDELGKRYAWVTERPGSDRLRFYNPLTFVGQERFHTRVWLAGEECACTDPENHANGFCRPRDGAR